MKLKYYLRGIGIGVIVTTLIFMISIAIHRNDIEQQNTSLQEVNSKTVAEAASEKKETEVADVSNTQQETEKEPQVETEKETEVEMETENNTQTLTSEQEIQAPVTEAAAEPEKVRFEIGGGEYSDVTCRRLQEAGLIDDAAAFNKFLIQKDYDNLILPGVYDIPKDSTYEEIAALLTTKVERETAQ